jgi:hypothetical protein
MSDAKRRRRHSPNHVKRAWYARHRCIRFARRFFAGSNPAISQSDRG